MEKIALAFRLQRIRETDFHYDDKRLSTDFLQGHPIHVGLCIGLSPDLERDRLELNLGIHYHVFDDCIETELLHYGAAFLFDIERLPFYLELHREKIAVDPELLSLLLSIAVGSIRGMLALRTSHTLLNDYPLPVVNITTMMASLRGNPLENAVLPPLFGFRLR